MTEHRSAQSARQSARGKAKRMAVSLLRFHLRLPRYPPQSLSGGIYLHILTKPNLYMPSEPPRAYRIVRPNQTPQTRWPSRQQLRGVAESNSAQHRAPRLTNLPSKPLPFLYASPSFCSDYLIQYIPSHKRSVNPRRTL